MSLVKTLLIFGHFFPFFFQFHYEVCDIIYLLAIKYKFNILFVCTFHKLRESEKRTSTEYYEKFYHGIFSNIQFNEIAIFNSTSHLYK